MGVEAPELVVERRRVGRLLPALVRRPLDTLEDILAGRDAVFLELARKRLVALNNPSLVETVFSDPDARGRITGLADSTALRLGGTSLPGIEGDAHRNRRAVVEGLFAEPQAWAAPVGEATRRVADRWQRGIVDIGAEMEVVAADAVATAVFGADYERERQPLADYHAVSRKVVMRIVNPLSPLLWRAPLPLTRRFGHAQRGFAEAVARMIARRRADGGGGGDVLEGLLAEGNGLTDAEVRDEAWSYYAQGAPPYALTWVWWLLGRDEDAEGRLHDEVDGAGADAGLEALPFTQAVVREALRLFPPGWALVHPAAHDRVVGAAEVPAGMPMLVSPWVLHRDPRFWPRPGSFDPDRWLGARVDDIRPGSYVGFGAGPRRCPARPFAELMLAVIVAAIARRWQLRPTASSVRLAYVPFLHPKGGLPVELVPRLTA